MSTSESRNVSSRPKFRNSAHLYCHLTFLILLFLFLGSVYFFLSISHPDSPDPGPREPPFITKLAETIQPEDRDVFQDFRTSFMPADHNFLSDGRTMRSKRNIYGGNYNITRIWVGRPVLPVRRKRNERKTPPGEEEPSLNALPSVPENGEGAAVEGDEINSPETEDYEDYEEDDNIPDRMVKEARGRPEDRGPLDDVVEQVRAQPELEEGELGTVPRRYRLPRRYSGIHAFWKGQGDKETIRHTQANIMRQYMDADADPCQDFFQYACGNWPTLNPVPADKAGYDTFEMLRENLDSVLKDLLDFKKNEHVPSEYPGEHLDLHGNSLKRLQLISHSDHLADIIPRNRRSASRENYSTIDTKIHLLQRIHQMIHSKNNTQRNNPVKQTKRKTFKTGPQMTKDIFQTHYVKEKQFSDGKKLYRRHGRQLMQYKKPKRDTTIIIGGSKNFFHKEDPAHGDATLKARFLFKSCMNYQILEKRAHQPLLDLLDVLGGWPILNRDWEPSKFDWLDLMAKLRLYNNDILISEWVGPDIKNSDEFVIQFDQTSLGLPTRDYFLQESNRAYLQAYKEYLIKIVLLLGGNEDEVQEKASQLIEFETRLARITSAPEERRNVSELYRRMPLQKLEVLVPGVQWRRYLCIVMNRTVDEEETVVLFAMKYVQNLVALINSTEPSTLSNYLLWRFVRHRVNNLDDRFQEAKQQFYNVLFGREQAPPRWKNCIAQVNSNMGMALGSMFVRKYFDENSKNDTLTMTREIQKSFRELLHLTDWIDSDTKRLAAHKVDAMMLRIGYPDFILKKKELDERYQEVWIHPDKYFENILNILQHLTKMEQARLGQPVNKTLWNTAPAVVNAYYSRNKNQIMFPAGILQPPFYHRHFPKSLNYGGIGVVIGHEITHGFDDKGRLFDCDGNLHRWWSDSAIEAFHRRAQCLIDQYGKYVVPEVNMKLDGVNTQGENIADNGGVKQAFRAYKRWLSEHGEAAAASETMPGLNHTHTQLFFLNFAQVWCGSMRPEAMRNKLKTAVHSPGRFRVIGALSNSEDFAREFSCRPGSPMNPLVKCSVW